MKIHLKFGLEKMTDSPYSFYIAQLLECVELNKFQPYETETELVQASLDLINNKTLWGGKCSCYAFSIK